MLTSRHFLQQQNGSVLLEGLIAILIFSMGILAIVGMQANAINNVAESKYRMEASFLASQIIAAMWSEVPIQIPNYALADGATPSAQVSGWVNQVNQTLPNATTYPPIIAIRDVSDTTGNRYEVTVTVRWKSPKAHEMHRFVTSAYINRNT